MKVRIKSGDCPEYLTVGKVYEVIGINRCGKYQRIYFIRDDFNRIRSLEIGNSRHLSGGSWEVVEE